MPEINVILPKNYSDDFKQVLSQPYNSFRKNLPVVRYKNLFFTHTGIGLKWFRFIPETFFENLSKGQIKHFKRYALYKYFLGKKTRVRDHNILLIHNHWSQGYHHWLM